MPEPVTCLMPVKDAMPFLPQALASIQAQTYPHIRIIAWDNGSTDGSAQELRRWIPTHIPGQVITDRPMGLGACLAQMVLLADTPLCARVDADDISLPDRIEKQVAFMHQHPDVAVLGTHTQPIDTHSRPIPGAWDTPTHDAQIRWRLRFCNAINHPTVLLRWSMIIAAGNYRDIKPGQDYDLWLRVAGRARMANLPDRLVQYRRHTGSVEATYQGQSASVVRRIACDNAAILFPDTPPQLAIKLRDLVACCTDAPVSWHHVLAFRHAATHAALAAGECGSYFRQTPLYRQQQSFLWKRWVGGITHRTYQPAQALPRHPQPTPSPLRKAA